jgi:hypothetical protein
MMGQYPSLLSHAGAQSQQQQQQQQAQSALHQAFGGFGSSMGQFEEEKGYGASGPGASALFGYQLPMGAGGVPEWDMPSA